MNQGDAVERRELARRVTVRALGWLHRNRHLGSFPADTTAELADPDGVYKPLGESALAAGMAYRAAAALPDEQNAARALLEFGWDQLRRGDLLYERQLRYPMMTDPLEVYAHFAAAGYRHSRLDGLLAHLAATDSYRAVEQMPSRRLAVANAVRLTGLSPAEDCASLMETTWLGRRPEPWLIDWMTAYCMTHTVFHVTDWGRRPHALPDAVVDYLTRWLPVWMEVWAEISEWDLLGELVIVDACLPDPQCPVHVWRQLATAQRADGLVPRDGEPVSGSEREAFAVHHHTTAVAVMAGALTLGRDSDAVPAD
ncbi:DUF6895 family protein [Streptomyces thermolilacinus]|uniref:DUF6895 family protein n=1 Tax=Streptomyces thermolilacinus TaxID=285540 RepID=UPI0033F77C2A